MLGQDFENPFGLTTPKGEQRKMSSLLDLAVFPGTQGGPLEQIIAAKAIAYEKALSGEYLTYITQVQKNAAVMAGAFVGRNYTIISGGTDNHLLLIDLRNKHISGKAAEAALGKAGITVKAITSRGLIESDMLQIAELIDRVLSNPDDETTTRNARAAVYAMIADHPLYT